MEGQTDSQRFSWGGAEAPRPRTATCRLPLPHLLSPIWSLHNILLHLASPHHFPRLLRGFTEPAP